jgi:hypothetical protein
MTDGLTQTCSICKNTKPILEFGKHSKYKSGYRNQCKLCHNKRNNLSAATERTKRRRANVRQRNRRFIYGYLQDKFCKDCGDARWQVLEFDHINPEDKKYEISQMVSSSHSIKTIQEEIDKCEIRCANCHKLKTMSQLDLYKNEWEINSLIDYEVTHPKGLSHPSSILDAEQVIDIRKYCIRGAGIRSKIKDMATKYNVSVGCITKVVYGYTYTD